MTSYYSEPTETHFILPWSIISRFGCQFWCGLNLCPERVVFFSSWVCASKSISNLSLAHTHTRSHTHKCARKHQRPPGTPFCHPISPKQHTSLPRPAPTKAAIIWVLPKTPRALAPLFNSLLSNYHRLGTGEESGLIRSFLFTCSQNTHAHILTQ